MDNGLNSVSSEESSDFVNFPQVVESEFTSGSNMRH